MECIFLDGDGICTIFDPNIENSGWDENGKCICYDDPDPSNLCDQYESNN